jgi:hypothetical protein
MVELDYRFKINYSDAFDFNKDFSKVLWRGVLKFLSFWKVKQTNFTSYQENS